MKEEMVHLRENMTWEEQKRAIETSLFLGFESEYAEFPIVSKEVGIEVSSLDELYKLYAYIPQERGIPKEYVSATKQAKHIDDFDWRVKKGLETIFSEGFFLKDKNHDMLPDCLDFKIWWPEEGNISLLTAACNLAFRFGMETTAYEGFLVASSEYRGNLLVFESDTICKMELEEQSDRWIVRVCGDGEELEEFSAYVCEHFPLQSDAKTWSDYLQEMTDSFVMKNLDGQCAYLKTFEGKLQEPVQAFVSPASPKRMEEIQEIFPKAEFRNYKGMKKVYEEEYDIPWEVDIFNTLLEKELYRELKPGDVISVYGALSEEKPMRDTIINKINQTVCQQGAKVEDVEIICAYKQGFSWIEEVVLPKLCNQKLDGQELEKVEIAFQPFLSEGMDTWGDEDGATPSYNNTKADNPDKWYDLPIRFLQELYPIEDIIATQLHLEREQIVFTEYKGTEELTYVFRALDQKNQEILKMNYQVAYSERAYLDAYPDLGKVHPNTGYLKILKNGITVWNGNILTDIEQIWNIYQEKVLPQCVEFVEAKTKGMPGAEEQPFFSQLRLDIIASEPNYRLKSREDLISSLDALHEDLYFVGTDYFKNYGMEKVGQILDAPGLILPVIKQGVGKPTFKVTLYEQEAEQPCLVSKGQTITSLASREQTNAYMYKLSYQQHEITAHIHVKTPEKGLVCSYAELMDQNRLEMARQMEGIHHIEFTTLADGNKESSYMANVSPLSKQEKTLDIEEIDLLEHDVIGYEQYLDIIEQLKKVPGIQVYKTATSYAGREIYAIELLPTYVGYLSRTKRLTRLPSEIINSRHHANEVSSTNAAFMLLKTLLTDESYAKITDQMNLVIVPMENVDGTAIHYELQKENPHWKFHVARFNAIGKEFYHEHFKSDTIHTEAQGFTWLWRHCLPDIVVDNHGVPSHEWEQPFSGYTSPSFKGFWLPRSLLYGYFWSITGEEYKGNYKVNKKIEEVIADAIGENAEIRTCNQEWMGRFEKYAHHWMPKLFPANYYKDMINYWIPFSYDAKHRYPSIRFPWITTVAYTSEVADETAQGDYLYLCANAHRTHDLAIIQMLMNCECVMEEKRDISDTYVSVSCIRQRPIVV
ncbi:MAG: M14 family metallopeptidase [Lachnospiraceae bacterium]